MQDETMSDADVERWIEADLADLRAHHEECARVARRRARGFLVLAVIFGVLGGLCAISVLHDLWTFYVEWVVCGCGY